MDESSQLDLFGSPRPQGSRADITARERLEREHAEAAEIAARLPGNVFFGTSSWGFPGWAGLVYSRRASQAVLAREGLAEYARHPLLTTVGIDRGFYAPIPEADLLRYAEQLPAGFRCCAKAPAAVTAAQLLGQRAANPDFLRPERFVEEMVEPFRAAFADHAGPFLLQFPPAGAGHRDRPAAFAAKLGRFLAALPRDFRYAVELRDPALLTMEYRAALAHAGSGHVYNYATAMPMPKEQAAAVPLEATSFAVIRLLLAPGTRYNDRREEFEPFDRIVAPDLEMRRQVVSLARQASSLGHDVFVLVNNKAEGCSPLTIRALAELLASESV
ncbi:MAG TPA: DUF72 domain-containing protein [Thermoanaerobaculia bacterium]|nr:DUF72 domain-containing protein [Thermoanaerobaculia bacterium]